MVQTTTAMNFDTTSSNAPNKQLWTQPLQSYSRSDSDGHERNAILSSVRPLQPRAKRSRINSNSSKNGDLTEEEERDSTTWKRTGEIQQQQFSSHKPLLQVRPLSLDRGAIAPTLASPTAPFAKSERKRAYVSAIYYSECFLRGIRPMDADTAAFTIQNQYTKWWVESKNVAKKKRKRGNSSVRDESRQPSEEETGTRCCDQALELTEEQITELKERLVEHLQKTGGDTNTDEFKGYCDQLRAVYQSKPPKTLCRNGTWLTLSKPTFSECQGRNEHGEYMYTLGRMSFDMFRPTHLKCSIRAVMNNIRVMDPKSKPRSFPNRLAKELKDNTGTTNNPIHHYDVVVAFTIEAGQTRDGTPPSSEDEFVIPRPIRGLMTNHGYMVADPCVPQRSSIWFSGGSIEVQDEVNDVEIWNQLFDESLAPRRDMRAMANLLAAKVLLGAYTTTTPGENDTGSDDPNEAASNMNYFFKRPIGGHSEVYCDALYEDETLRIIRGHRGSIFVFNRVPSFEAADDDGNDAQSVGEADETGP